LNWVAAYKKWENLKSAENNKQGLRQICSNSGLDVDSLEGIEKIRTELAEALVSASNGQIDNLLHFNTESHNQNFSITYLN
jgi:hypothetical protein